MLDFSEQINLSNIKCWLDADTNKNHRKSLACFDFKPRENVRNEYIMECVLNNYASKGFRFGLINKRVLYFVMVRETNVLCWYENKFKEFPLFDLYIHTNMPNEQYRRLAFKDCRIVKRKDITPCSEELTIVIGQIIEMVPFEELVSFIDFKKNLIKLSVDELKDVGKYVRPGVYVRNIDLSSRVHDSTKQFNFSPLWSTTGPPKYPKIWKNEDII